LVLLLSGNPKKKEEKRNKNEYMTVISEK